MYDYVDLYQRINDNSRVVRHSELPTVGGVRVFPTEEQVRGYVNGGYPNIQGGSRLIAKSVLIPVAGTVFFDDYFTEWVRQIGVSAGLLPIWLRSPFYANASRGDLSGTLSETVYFLTVDSAQKRG